MKRLLVCVPAMAAAFALSTATAEAGPFTLQDGVTFTAVYNISGPQGTGACDTSGDCEATISYTLDASAGTLTIELENTSTDGLNNVNVLTGLQFNTTPDLTGEAVDSQTGGVSGWTVNFDQGLFDLTAAGQGQPEALDDGDTGTFVISFTNLNLTSLLIKNSQVHFQGVNGDSDKLICCEEGEEGEGEEGEGETPEPASLVLLGTALTAAGFRMRRVRA